MKLSKAIFFIVIVPWLLLCSCSGDRAVSTINSVAMFSKKPVSLPISSKKALLGYSSHGFMTFESDLTIEDISKKIENDDLTVSTFKDAVFISRPNTKTTRDYFCIKKLGEGAYSFGAMRGLLATDIAGNGDKKTYAYLMPVHLIADERLRYNTPEYQLYVNTEYETTAGVNEFYEFYQSSGWYDLEKHDDFLLIKGYSNKESVIGDETDTYGSLDIDITIKFVFRSYLDKKYFGIQLVK